MEIVVTIIVILILWLVAGAVIAFFLGPYLKGKDIDK